MQQQCPSDVDPAVFNELKKIAGGDSIALSGLVDAHRKLKAERRSAAPAPAADPIHEAILLRFGLRPISDPGVRLSADGTRQSFGAVAADPLAAGKRAAHLDRAVQSAGGGQPQQPKPGMPREALLAMLRGAAR
jgi:hypothetical protein